MNIRRLATDAVLAVAVVTGISVVIGAAESVSHVSNISNLYVVGVAVLASRRGLWPAVLASVLAFDWFFIPPVHQFVVDEPSEYVALLTLLATSVIISQLLAVAHRRAGAALRSQHQTQLLYDVSEAVLSSPNTDSVYPPALWRLNDALRLVGSRLYLKDGDGLRQVASSGSVPVEAHERRPGSNR